MCIHKIKIWSFSLPDSNHEIKYTIFLDFERIWWRFFHERFVILYNGIGDLWTGWPALIWERKYSCWHHPLMLAAGYPKALIPFHVPNNITCLCVSPLSFHMVILLYQHNQSALDTIRTLFLLASTQGASCRLVMNHLLYVCICSLSRQVWMSIFHIINFKKIIIIHGHRGPGFFLIKN